MVRWEFQLSVSVYEVDTDSEIETQKDCSGRHLKLQYL